MLMQARLLFHTLRYLKPSQLYLRLWGAVKRLGGLARLPLPPVNLRGGLRPGVAFVQHDTGNQREQLEQGVFRFLNRSEKLGQPVDWQVSRLSLLWQFNLHYFNYLYLLNRVQQIELCRQWIAANAPGKGVAWQAYPTSLRIVNWCKANFDDDEILKSLYMQAAYLYRHLEAHHRGNHLLENARALLFAGNFFHEQGEADKWLAKGLQIYRRETPLQVLSDGGYFERSPMYHALMLEGYLDILNILPPTHSDRELFVDTAKRMSDFLLSVTKPDGEIALFNDSTREIAPPTAALPDYTKRLLDYDAAKGSAFPESGYFVHDSDSVYLIIDGGVLGADFLLAHAHADIFSFELSIAGKAFIVDSGVYEYQAGEMRDYGRSTAAHNTVCIDGLSQAECWGSFRVARRYPPRQVAFDKGNGKSRFQGQFDGYAKLIGDNLVHHRRITCDEESREIVIADEVTGFGKHRVESRLHLHPEVKVEHQGKQVILERDGVPCTIDVDAPQTLKIEDGWYCPEFGVKLANKVLVCGGEQPLPTRLGYKIAF